jgi:iron complex outermembrane recepter protein
MVGVAATLWLLQATVGHAGDSERKYDFDVREETLGAALNAIAQQTDLIVLFPNELAGTTGMQSVTGWHTVREAIRLLLRGTRLSGGLTEHGVIYISISETEQARNGEIDMTDRRVRKSLWAGVAAFLSGIAAHAQETQSVPGGAPSGTIPSEQGRIEEIIVTAQKRSESVQDVPMSIAVIGNLDIERRGLIGMEDYLRSIPGVNQVDRGSVDNAIVIRGIATSPENEVFSVGGTTVATYFDETPITAAAGGVGVDVRPVDIERIEVLRGPQGTAYGSSSLGGTLRILPKKPQLGSFGAKAAVSYSETGEAGSDNTMVQGVLNVPVADTLALRAVGYRYDDSGYFRNVAGSDPATLAIAERNGMGDYVRDYFQDDVGRMVSVGGRVSALWAPTDNLNVTLTYLTQTIEQDGAPEATFSGFRQARIAIAPQTRVRGEEGEVSDTEMDMVSAVLNYDMGWATLTTVGSWIDGSAIFARDFTYIFNNLSTSIQDTRSRTRSAEARLASQLSGPLQFLAGVYYEDVDYSFDQTVDWPGTPQTSPFAGSTTPLLLSIRDRELEQRAAFGEVSYHFTHKLTTTLGGRFYRYDRSEASLREGALASATPIGGGVAVSSKTDEEGSSLKANLSYQPNGDSLVYLSWSEGFRLGRPDAGLALCDGNGDGIVDGTSVTVESTQTIASDFLENFELGSKFVLFERRMAIDASVFHIKWDGLPMRVGRPPGATCTFAYTTNVGGATSDGVELQASVFVTQGLRIDFGGSYTKAELSEDAPRLLPPAFDGDRLPGSPEVNLNLAAQYDFDIAGNEAFVRADSFYTGKVYGDLQQTPNTLAGDYIKVDARAGVTINRLNVELFVRNVTNEDSFTWRGLNGSRGPEFGYVLRPRTIGLQLGYSFE